MLSMCLPFPGEHQATMGWYLWRRRGVPLRRLTFSPIWLLPVWSLNAPNPRAMCTGFGAFLLARSLTERTLGPAEAGPSATIPPSQLAALRMCSAIVFSVSGVNASTANEVTHRSPSSRFEDSSKPSVA